jgi:hypothetical protein
LGKGARRVTVAKTFTTSTSASKKKKKTTRARV